MKNLWLIFFFIIFSTEVFSQYYVSGQDRSSIKWMQINTADFRIVYPDYADSIARDFAYKLSWAYNHVTTDMNHKPSKIDVLIHTEASNSNGMVVWAPKRMEIFNTFPQDIYPQEWLSQLALHEYRHVIQIDKLNQGITKILSFIIGQQGTGVVLGLYIPLWFLEGDAVWAETNYSFSGRGRQDVFSAPLRAQFLQKKIYSFDKATMGSYKNFVPDHYIIGYNFVNMVRKDFGDSVWPLTLDYVARNPYMIVPFSHSLKKYTGFNKKNLYKQEMSRLDSLWRKELLLHKQKPAFVYKDNDKWYSNYLFPAFINDSVMFALKTGIDIIPRFISIDINKGVENKIFVPGNSEFYNVSYADSVFCWSEIRYDLRWTHRRYHVIMVYNLREGKVVQISKKSNYFAPQLNNDASKIVCVENTVDNRFFICVLNAETGEVLKRFRQDFFPSFPVWGSDDMVYFLRLIPNEGQTVAALDLKTGKVTNLLPPDYYAKSHLTFLNNRVLFTAEYNGVMNIYELSPENGNIKQLTDFPFPVKSISPAKKSKVAYSYLTADGIKIGVLDSAGFNGKVFHPKNSYNSAMFKYNPGKYGRNIQDDSLPHFDVNSKRYSKAAHLFNIHSWAPLVYMANTYELNPGISFMSQNLLGTAVTTGGYQYLRYNSVNLYYLDFVYKGFYPDLSLRFRVKNGFFDDENEGKLHFNSYAGGVGIGQPLNLSKGKFFRYLYPMVSYDYYKMTDSKSRDYFYQLLHYRFYGHWLLKKGLRDMRPKWGQRFDFNYYHTPLGGVDIGCVTGVELKSYLPGLFNHHSLQIYTAWQKKKANYDFYNDIIEPPRGYDELNTSKLLSLKADYLLPLWYPDFSMGSLAYVKRLKLNIFTDLAYYTPFSSHSNYAGYETSAMSIGFELSADAHLLRLIAPFDIGFRTVYATYTGNVSFSFLIKAGLDSM